MSIKGLKSRTTVIAAAVAVVAAFMLYAFWPRPMAVDIGEATRAPMLVTIDEEAKTRVRDAYVVSAPVRGRLLRVDVEPGDEVVESETVIARMTPTNPAVLDVRTEEQARAAVEAAEAALTLAKAEMRRAAADADLAEAEFGRTRKLRETDTVSEAALDRAKRAARAADAALDTARAAVSMREADLDNARAMLMTPFEAEQKAAGTNPHPQTSIPLRAPISGRILRVMQESETVLPAGAPILEIGDPLGDLEIVAELLSTDAVKVSPGDRVIIEKWGGEPPLEGRVEKIEPWGFTKYSALGVEEQRVNAVIQFDGPEDARERLGHGFRVEVRIAIWEDDNALTIPSSAVFRSGEDWAVFAVERGRAQMRAIEAGRNNGIVTQVISGLSEGDEIILYPGNRVSDGARVKQRALE
ncbi:efflux RND transporter periplasmic adaptor subunit [Hyphococcus sp.]|uniref:efflux RND transporter periplasmic adaptor subunit n=1 Tax=Hyphococcus sp. TaxID=2038636 RepID=UPI0035C77E8D